MIFGNRKKLDEEIANQIELVCKATPEDRDAELDYLNRLLKMRSELGKGLFDKIISVANVIIAAAGIGVSVAGIVAPLHFYQDWLKAGFEYEENGIITSPTFKNLTNKFRPTKLDV